MKSGAEQQQLRTANKLRKYFYLSKKSAQHDYMQKGTLLQ